MVGALYVVGLLLCQLWQLFGGIYTFLLALWGSSQINLNRYEPWAGRSMVQFPCIHSIACYSVSFHYQPDFHFIPVVTGASEGIGRGYALEVSILLLFSFMHTDLRIASSSVGQARAECGHHESLSGQIAESG